MPFGEAGRRQTTTVEPRTETSRSGRRGTRSESSAQRGEPADVKTAERYYQKALQHKKR
jgi:hypothetical protein